MRRHRIAAAAAAVAAAGALALGLAGAQDTTAPAPVLHEYIEPPAPGAGHGGEGAAPAPVFGAEPAIGRNPSAIRAGSKILPRPSSPGSDEPVHGHHGFAVNRETEARPDYVTGADGTLHYVEVFNPAVVPFKRMTALDAVREDYTLITGRSALEDLDVGGEPTADEELFWAHLVVDFAPGEDVPIPSVAPDMRILSYEVDPITTVDFSKDGADNFYVRTDEANARGEHRLVFLAAAPSVYFAPVVPQGYRVRDIDRGRVRPLPPRVEAVAHRAHRELGLTRDMPLEAALDKLTYHFRAFTAGDPPQSSGDIYWDLFHSQTGVCRHRSFAFMVTANALGIPTRYVANEAHAWVEVWVPESGWLRVDLGGAALRLQVSNAGDKAMHRPRSADPFAQPESYTQSYTRLEGDVRGLRPDQIAEARRPLPEPGEPDDGGAEGGEAAPGGPRPKVAPGRNLPELPASAYAGKEAVRIVVDSADATGYRGETIKVAGRVQASANGTGAAGLRVDIFLAPAGGDGNDAELLGHTVTGPDGSYATEVTVPRTLEPRDYEVFAATPGDAKHQPALSE